MAADAVLQGLDPDSMMSAEGIADIAHRHGFDAELLSPFASVYDMLGGDYSEEKQNDAAERFRVSPMTIRTQLVNNHCIDREEAPDIANRGTAA